MGRIPWTAIYKFAEVHEMDSEEFQLFEYVITRLDLFYVEWVHQQMKPDGGADADI